MIRAYRVTRAKADAIESRREHPSKSPSNLNQTTKGPLVSRRSGVNQNPALDGLAGRPWQNIDALFQGAGRITAVDRDLCHESVGETMRHDVLCPLTVLQAVGTDLHACGPSCRSPCIRSCTQSSSAEANLVLG